MHAVIDDGGGIELWEESTSSSDPLPFRCFSGECSQQPLQLSY